MKKTLLTLLLALSTPALMGVYGQESITHFDNKPYVEGEFLVQMKAGRSLKEVLKKMPEQYKVKQDHLLSKTMRVYLVTFDHHAISHSDFQALLYSQKEVSVADYNYKIDMRSTIPTDTDFSDQWHHVNTGQTGGTADADIDSDLAWDITTGGQTATNDDIVVCLIESGNLDHVDLDGNRWFNANEIPNNGVDDDGNGYIDDYNGWNPVAGNDDYGTGGHGTNCLGMIGAKGNNGTLVAGANWDVKLMVVGDYSISTQANAIEAYEYPLAMRKMWNNTNGSQGAFVVATSSSWGIDGADPTQYPLWCAFYDTLGKYGVLNVGATTNSNLDVDTQGDMPTACGSDYMIGVGRTDHNDNTAGGYGATTIEFGAPGIDVVTTANTNTITTTTGTSFSCPLTAGVIGLAYSIPCPSFMAIVKANPQQGADLVLQALLSGTDPKAALASKFVTGGRLNAKNTLDDLMTATCSGSICLAPSGITASNITGTSADINWNPYDSATQYVFYYQEAGSGSWSSTNVTGTTYNMTGLIPCTNYEFYMQSICDTDSSSTTSVQTFITMGCGNCVDLTYCTNSADGSYEWIESVEIDAWSNVSGGDGGYGDFTNGGAASLTLDLNQSYNFTLTPGFNAGSAYDESFRIWIDLDQNGTFDPSDMVYDQGAYGQVAVSGSFTVPGTATLGSTRMRVQMSFDDPFAPVCGSFDYGEVEDYCVEIIQSVVCGYSVTNSIQDPTCADLNDGSIGVSVTGGTAPYTYDWGSLGTNSSVTGLGDGSYQLVITDDTGCDTTINYQLDYTTALDVSVSATDASCNGSADGQVDATATGSTGYTYLWSNGVTTASNPNIAAGTYDVTVTDADGCTADASGTVNEPVAIDADFTTFESGMDVQFGNNSTSGTYLWDFGDGNTSTATDPVHTYASEGQYTVCLTVTTSCGSDSTCTTVESVNTSGVETNEDMLFSYYPNPASDQMIIANVSADVRNIEIVDATGRLLESYRVNNATFNVNVKRMSNGTYFLIAKNEQGKSLGTYKFTVQK